MDEHADGYLSQARRSGSGWVGGYVMDGRDTVIARPSRCGLSQTRPGLERPRQGVGVMYLS